MLKPIRTWLTNGTWMTFAQLFCSLVSFLLVVRLPVNSSCLAGRSRTFHPFAWLVILCLK